ncbi:MAG: vanadium-dependent haloperoxidase [Bacteroidota bacterium]|nr:vanadium-dependent haloperoxidase [Bacteroidota bacterium]MDP4215719.1 vanadium-dependent haloperoxidase [Bacteroidota bacterium]MDP4244781.1 vanadium-dependent haloperoxidase [Bacteroidota bacterium]MDP4256268.1 vanadium-dependent haloperoxidase [Bacteroidota bacterium]MDP4259330.1 vanadium-dependent haloperoxidase [Bacteroidota bacterium]
MRYRFIILTSLLGLGLCREVRSQAIPDAQIFRRCARALTDVIVHDITPPPVASRDYVYPMIAAYEAARPGDSAHDSFAGKLNGLTDLPKPEAGQKYDWLVAGTTAFYNTAYAFVFTKSLFRQYWDPIDSELRERPVEPDVYARSVAYGQRIAARILDWSKQDHYIETRSMPRFTPGGKPGTWQQTGPEYMEAVEPYWNYIRTMTLSRPDQFLIPEPASFTSQRFADERKEVSETGKHLTDEERACAAFWDCNPFAVTTVGHLVYSVKKISPGGHWIGVTGMVIGLEKQPLVPALYSYCLVSIALFDGFIAAWDEKYRTNYIRPVTAIQQAGLPLWQPMLQTPPFPEYPSAHSVISMAVAVVLTGLYGDHYHYTDVTEEPYGLPGRKFASFMQAASEAAISRLYGGIHFREAIENGSQLGLEIGNQIVRRFDLHPVGPHPPITP